MTKNVALKYWQFRVDGVSNGTARTNTCFLFSNKTYLDNGQLPLPVYIIILWLLGILLFCVKRHLNGATVRKTAQSVTSL